MVPLYVSTQRIVVKSVTTLHVCYHRGIILPRLFKDTETPQYP